MKKKGEVEKKIEKKWQQKGTKKKKKILKGEVLGLVR